MGGKHKQGSFVNAGKVHVQRLLRIRGL